MVSYNHLLLFMLKIETTTRGTNSMPFLVFPTGSFAVYNGDDLRFGIICGPVWWSFPVWGSFTVGDHLRRCTVHTGECLGGGGGGHLLGTMRNVNFRLNSHSRPQSSSLLRMTDGEKSSGEPWTKLFRYLLLVETKKARLIGQSATR